MNSQNARMLEADKGVSCSSIRKKVVSFLEEVELTVYENANGLALNEKQALLQQIWSAKQFFARGQYLGPGD
jgi:hypothetical protein